ncbi:MAG: 6-phosphogluconolactonase [Thermodesulfobacteriota bacterium]
MTSELYEVEHIEGLCRRAAELILAAGREAVQKRGRFTLVLTGGRTVQNLYKYLAGSGSGPELKEILGSTDFFLGDERWVAADHPDSNGGMAQRLLLAPLGVADSRIFLIPTGFASPEDGAADYEKTLRVFFAKELAGGARLPEFDLVLLGMGSDGHVASLFPGTDALQEKERWVTTSFPPYLTPAVERITMTVPVLNRAGEVVLMVTGADKQAIVRKIMADPQAAARDYPAGLVKSTGRDIWLLADN